MSCLISTTQRSDFLCSRISDNFFRPKKVSFSFSPTPHLWRNADFLISLRVETNSIAMAKTNYRLYRWAINTLYDADKYGYPLSSLQNLYRQFRRETMRELTKKKGEDVYELKGPEELKRTTFYNWRVQIWVQFGLIIDTPVYDNYYVLKNKELLDEDKTLRDMIDHLVEDEERGFQTETLIFSKRGRKPKNAKQPVPEQMTGFISVGGNVDYYAPQYGAVEEPEMVDAIRFAMTFGEALVINDRKYNLRVDNIKAEPDRYVLEPQQLKCINGRWYVIGNLYEYGNPGSSRVSVYDVERIWLCEDEDVVNPRYTVVEGYDVYTSDLFPADWTKYFNPDKVVSMYLMFMGNVMRPFCPAQELVESLSGRLYRVYLKPDKDFFIQYMAAGRELVACNPYERIERTPIDITDVQIMYLEKLKREMM